MGCVTYGSVWYLSSRVGGKYGFLTILGRVIAFIEKGGIERLLAI